MSSLYFLTRVHHRTTSRILSSPLVYTSLSRSFSTSISTSTSSTSQKPLFDKILIANRGEIACRIIRTCKKMGIKTVAVYSEPDAEALHVRTADEAICVGPAQSAQSYLNIPNILAAVKQTGAQAVHPGYGFLSENRHFQEALQAAGVKFLGPGTKAITAMGTKISSKKIATEAKVNVIPGYLGKVPDENEAVRIAREIGYPVMIKASSGGGGKGMRVAYNDQEVKDGFRLSSAEAKSSFGDDTMFVEKFIEEPRHIEIQVLADSHGNAVYLNERECTVQRRNQKVIEEAPSIFLDPATRKAMGEQAVRLAKTVGYESAGTVEFLVDKHRNFYYLEMNTRLQVEHPVTEYITGVDLVEQMIRVGAGLPLPFTQEQIPINGWAFETRVYAEDPLRGFLPSIGRLSRYEEPEKGPNVRIDTGVVEGAEISIYYDPMIAKLITYGKDRDEALQRMRVALDAYVIRGVTHNVNFLRSLCDHPRFIKGALTTAFIPEEYPKGYHGATLSEEEKKALVAAALAVHSHSTENKLTINGKVKSFDSQRFHSELLSDNVVLLGNDTFQIKVDKIVHNYNDSTPSHTFHLTLSDHSRMTITTSYKRGDIVFIATINNKEYTLQVVKSSDGVAKYTIQYAGTAFDLTIRTPREHHLTSYMPVQEVIDTSKMVLSPMPGAVYSINVAVGDMVAPGQEVCVVEAMKMQNALRAVNGGKVKAIHVKKGQTVQPDQLLVEFE